MCLIASKGRFLYYIDNTKISCILVLVIVMFTIAVITIGQSPRPDITSDLRKLLPEGVCMTEYGALDGLTRQQADIQKATGLETVLPRTVLIEELTALRNITSKDSADAR